ncbi:MAG: hypothetical protein CME68_01330 [Halobacteriovoraceae bacterium]|nr:hypothetical protein [Halobacteriovoraceae bacterium]
MHHNLQELNNKLKTLFVNWPGSSAATIQFWFRAGSALEKKEDYGIAHFLEHMFFKGSDNRPGSQIAKDIESIGGEINAFTSFDYTCYYINVPNKYLKRGTEILLDMVSNPKFDNKEIIPERGVVFEEFRRSLDNPGQFAFHELQKKFFRNGYNHPILGGANTIKNFSKSQLSNFRKKHYNISNSMLIVAGNLKNHKSIPKLIESFSFPKGNKSKFPKFELFSKSKVQVHKKDVKNAQLSIIIQAPEYLSGKSASEDLAINCLGHGESSRLFKGLVMNSALTNSSSSSTLFMSKGGVHFIKISFPYKNFDKLENTLHKIIKENLVNGFENKEVQKIKNQYLSSKVYDKETLESYAFSFGHSYAQNGDIYSEEKFINLIEKVETQEVNDALRDIFSRAIHIALQIPEIESLSKAEIKVKRFQKKLETLKELNGKKNDKAPTHNVQKSNFDTLVKLIEVKKGIKLLYRYNQMNPTFVLQAFLKGGLSEENDKSNGIYNMISGLMTSGYDNFSDDYLREVFENKSSSFSSFSGKNAYGLSLHGQTKDFKDLIGHFFGSLLQPNFPIKLIKHEKEMILRAIDNQEKDPVQQCFLNLNRILFNNHPYQLNILGTKKSVQSITRKKLQELHDKNLQNKEILLTYCGNLPLSTVYESLEGFCSNLSKRNKNTSYSTKQPLVYGKKVFINFDREQTQIFLGIPSGRLGSKDTIIFKMLTTYLQGQSSKLFVEVRDKKGLCYSIQPVHFTALEGGYWGVYLASGHDKSIQAINTIIEILEKMKNKGIPKKEFQKIKVMIEGQNLINIQTNEDFANIYSIPVLHGRGLDFFYNNNQSIQNLKYEDFAIQLKKILSKKLNIVVVGRENEEIKKFFSS